MACTLTKILLVKKKIAILKLLQLQAERKVPKKKRFWVRKVYAERLQKGELARMAQRGLTVSIPLLICD